MNKNFLLAICFICLSVNSLFCQNTDLRNWRAYMSFSEINQIACGEDEIVCATNDGLFTYNTDDFSLATFTKTTGLSDISIAAVAALENKIFLAYDNLNFDILENGSVTNIPAIKNSNINGAKDIFKIVVEDNTAFICGTFGIAVLDIENELIKETYSLTDGSEQVFAYDMVLNNQQIAVATNKGIFFADKNNPNLFNVNEWIFHDQTQNLPPTIIKEIKYHKEKYYALADSQILVLNNYDYWEDYYNSDTLWGIRSFTIDANDRIITSQKKFNNGDLIDKRIGFTENGNTTFMTDKVGNPENILIKDEIIYIADNYNGLLKITDINQAELISVNGPASSFNFDMEIDANGILWVASGTIDQSYSDAAGFDKGLYRYDGSTWQNYTRYNLANDSVSDLISVATNAQNDEIYFGANVFGLQLFKTEGYKIFSDVNSSLEADPNGFVRIFDIDFDANGNLWIANSDVNNVIKMRSSEGDWYSFSPVSNIAGKYTKVYATSYNQVWFVELREGIEVYDYGTDIYSSSDDRYKRISSGINRGGLPDKEVKCIIEDLDGEIWVGTSKGISIFFCAASIFDRPCDGFEPIVDINGILGPLLQDDEINDIAVDAANRKWVATGNGVWLLSDDGETVIENFTINNSPLLSNNVRSIEINDLTGEVFFGTTRGIISFKGNATQGSENFSNVNVFPNPVKPGYEGLITIENLKANSEIKITDLNGTLVHQRTSLGGQLQWDGKDYTGRKVQSGVYLIYANTGFNGSNYEGKFMILR